MWSCSCAQISNNIAKISLILSPYYGGVFDWNQALIRRDELEARAQDPGLWDDPAEAQKLLRERETLIQAMDAVSEIESELGSTYELAELAETENDEDMLGEAARVLSELSQRAGQAQIEALLDSELDGNDCYLAINAGAGGTESQDWAQMLRRMYWRWAEKSNKKIEELEEHIGDEAGIKSTTLLIKGQNAYGWLKSEEGVHRLVRLSPFDSSNRRHTSFASVRVTPVIDDSIEVEINEKDVRVDTYRASGAGGQHVNKTDSAVRLTHEPTGIVVQCQNQRSQHRNRETAWGMLRARLYELQLEEKNAAARAAEEARGEISFGSQIRSYVLQPYQMVKDLRSQAETSDTQAVLDGDIDLFLTASLAQGLEV